MLARVLAVCTFALVLAGCLPESANPITPPEQGLDAPELHGLWRSEMAETTLYVHVLRGAGPELEIVAVGHDADNTGSADLYVGHVSAVGPRRYLNLRPADAQADAAAPYWIFGYERGDDDGITLLFLSADTLARAVDDGRLTGEVTTDSVGRSVRLTASGEEIAAYLNETATKELFDRAIDFQPVAAP
jgi:hypothetical protein